MRDTTQLSFGLILLIVGLGFFLETLNLLPFGIIFGNWWPSLIVLWGLGILLNPVSSRVFALIIITLGLLLQLNQLDLITGNIFSYFWPLVLIAIGASILMNRASAPRFSSDKSVDLFAAFSGNEKALDTKGFEGGNITALFGGVKLDLRKATLTDNSILNVFTAFGGAEILVPEDCRVDTVGTSLFGGWDDKTAKPEKPKSKLTIKGTVLFGGFEVKN